MNPLSGGPCRHGVAVISIVGHPSPVRAVGHFTALGHHVGVAEAYRRLAGIAYREERYDQALADLRKATISADTRRRRCRTGRPSGCGG